MKSREKGVVAGIFANEEEAARAVDALLQEHFDPENDLSVIVSHRREHHTVPIRQMLGVGHGGEIGAAVGAVLAAVGVTLAGMTIGPFSLVAAGPAVVALEAAYAGGSAGFMLGAAAGLTQSKTEADFRLTHTHEGVVWVGVHATGERAARAREILSAAGARHFQD